MIWYYTFGVHCKKKFSRSHAHLFYFVKNAKNFLFNDREIRVPSARQLVYADARANPKGRVPDDTWILRPQDLPDGFAPDGDTWYVPCVCGTFKERAGWHGCQMPEQLLGRIIRSCSNEGISSSTHSPGAGRPWSSPRSSAASTSASRLSADYVAQIETRLQAAEAGQPLEGAAEPWSRQAHPGAVEGGLDSELRCRSWLVLPCCVRMGCRWNRGPGKILTLPSPFPGMDPYLEAPAIWPDLHDRSGE